MPTIMYAEGDWFAIPLLDGGFASGVISRGAPRKKGILIGYFFGPLRAVVPTLEDMVGLAAPDAILVRRFGHLGLLRGTWPLLGKLDGWDRTEWATPAFGRHEELTGRSLKIIYDNDDPSKITCREVINRSDLDALPGEGLLGVGAVESRLTALLCLPSQFEGNMLSRFGEETQEIRLTGRSSNIVFLGLSSDRIVFDTIVAFTACLTRGQKAG
jgi:hypothetical protein